MGQSLGWALFSSPRSSSPTDTKVRLIPWHLPFFLWLWENPGNWVDEFIVIPRRNNQYIFYQLLQFILDYLYSSVLSRSSVLGQTAPEGGKQISLPCTASPLHVFLGFLNSNSMREFLCGTIEMTDTSSLVMAARFRLPLKTCWGWLCFWTWRFFCMQLNWEATSHVHWISPLVRAS